MYVYIIQRRRMEHVTSFNDCFWEMKRSPFVRGFAHETVLAGTYQLDVLSFVDRL